ncbi:MAG: aminopeptidase P family protein [Thermoleophilaceae bacterium]|nr:aminopeptidase P family protein [Thermoleophilaceae bacterium]
MNVQAPASVEARTDRLVARMAEQELDCLLVTNLLNVRYLTGFTGTNGACIVTPDARLFLTDFRYVEQAAEQVRGYERLELGRDMLGDLAGRLHGRAGFEDSNVTVAQHAKLSESLSEGTELIRAGTPVESLREVKDPAEVAAMRAAAALADAAYRDMQERGLAGRTEREVAMTAVRLMEDMGADGPSFPPIVASGPAGALPHAVPRDVEIPSGVLVVVDMGARLDGYCSDCTRTFATGPVADAALEVYELVRNAQAEALAAVRAGAEAAAVDGVARAIIDAAGHGERFGHGLGHGVGLEVHEAPRVAKTATGELRAGHAVTVEPGVYVPGEFGVRIEDLVIVADGEPDVLTGFPKELVTAG